MVSYLDVKQGKVSLADLSKLAQYLEMKNDIEYANMPKTKTRKGVRG